MSGLVAIVNLDGSPVEKKLLETFTDALSSKGKEGSTMWIHDHIGFGHTLHKTTYEAEFEQYPCTLDGKVWLISTARIDDRENLINRLGLQSEIDLNTTPDSILVLYAYKAWDIQCLDYLSGDFAFIIWDERKKRLFCARDKFGVRQLYYTRVKNTLLLSNSLYCLLHHPQISTKFNDQVIADFLLFGESIWLDEEKNQTVFDEIYKIPPAHALTFRDNKYFINRYWHFPVNTPLLKYNDNREYTSHFLEIFKKTISDRLRNPNITISMSGGIDSTSIASIASEIRNENSSIENITAITSTYSDLYPDNERYYADLVAKKLDLQIFYLNSRDYSFLDTLSLTTRPMELYQPGMWLASFKKSAERSTILLNGYAGDNVLSFTPLLNMNIRELNQYNILRNLFYVCKKYKQFPSIGTGVFTLLRSSMGIQNLFKGIFPNYPEWFNKDFEFKMKTNERWMKLHNSNNLSTHNRHPRICWKIMEPDWCIDDLFFNNEFVIPEERDPFLDIRLINFILSVPPLPWLFNKHFLRSSMRKKLPEKVLTRPKISMGDTLTFFLNQECNAWVDKWKPNPELRKYIDREKIPRLSNGSNYSDAVVNIRPLILNQWLEGMMKQIGYIRNSI